MNILRTITPRAALLVILIIFITQTPEAQVIFSDKRNVFAGSLFRNITAGQTKNVIISPPTIKSSLVSLIFAAEEEMAQEFRTVLRLNNFENKEIAKKFEDFVQDSIGFTTQDVELRWANRVYVNNNRSTNSKSNEFSSIAFHSKEKQVNFTDSENAIKEINQFVEDLTGHNIKNFLQSDSVHKNTSSFSANAIYFNAKWQLPFGNVKREAMNFMYGKKKVEVETICMHEFARYAAIPSLNAQVLGLQFIGSDFLMFFFLPDTVDGLEKMEERLFGNEINEILEEVSVLPYQFVNVYIPKFEFEFDVDSKDLFKKVNRDNFQLGLETTYPNEANCSKIGLKDAFPDEVKSGKIGLEDAFPKKANCSASQTYIPEAKYKAVINVTEFMSEPQSEIEENEAGNLKNPEFRANHPFAFLITNLFEIYFVGHVVQL